MMGALNEPGAIDEFENEAWAAMSPELSGQLRRIQAASALGKVFALLAREFFRYGFMRGLQRGIEESAK